MDTFSAIPADTAVKSGEQPPAGHNILLTAGEPLFQAVIMLAQGHIPADITFFRRQMLQALSRFYRICAAHQVHPSLTGKSAFVWCAALDEAVLVTPWGATSAWHEHTLTGTVFQNRRGGEVFFRYLQLAVHNPGPLHDFLELQFYVLSLGFKGKYRAQPDALAACYVRLRHCLVTENKVPGKVRKTVQMRGNRPVRLFPLTLIISGALLVCIALRIAADVYYQHTLQQFSAALTTLL